MIYENAEFITNYDEFVKSANSNEYFFPISCKEMSQFYQFDEVPSYKKIANSLSKIIKDNLTLEQDVKKNIQYPEKLNLLFNESVIAKILNYIAYKTNAKILKNRKRIYLRNKKYNIDEYTMQMIKKNYASEIEIKKLINKFNQYINDI